MRTALPIPKTARILKKIQDIQQRGRKLSFIFLKSKKAALKSGFLSQLASVFLKNNILLFFA